MTTRLLYRRSAGDVSDAVVCVVELAAVSENAVAVQTLSAKLVTLGRMYGTSDRYFPIG